MAKRKRRGEGSPRGRGGAKKTSELHAEGQHGPKAHARFVEQLHERPREEPLEEELAHERRRSAAHGKRRLVDDRQQHDEAEKNSELTRLSE
jgi:hypothetical protein